MDKACPYCTLPEIRRRIVHENELVSSFLSFQPITPGHTLIIPKRCVANFDDLHKEEVDALFEMREDVTKALKRTFNTEGFNYAWNEGLVAGQTVPHFHFHIVPRTKGDSGIYKYEPRDFIYRPSGSRPLTPEEELQEVAALIRANVT